MDKNPMHELLRRQLGVDAFALDGDDTDIPDPWQPRPANVPPRHAAKAEAPLDTPVVKIGVGPDKRVETRVEIRRGY